MTRKIKMMNEKKEKRRLKGEIRGVSRRKKKLGEIRMRRRKKRRIAQKDP